MNNSKIRILQINASSSYGGVSAMILNYSKNLDLDKFVIDFLSPERTSYSSYKETIKKIDGNIYALNVQFIGLKKYFQLFIRYKKFLKKHKYDIVHINSGLIAYNFEIALISKLCGIKKIIIHSHSSINYSGIKNMIVNIIKHMIPFVATDYLACSKKAAESMFPNSILKNKKYYIVNNAIDVQRYKYSTVIRKKVRNELGIDDDKIILGHVGRFVNVKNHNFLLEIFSEILKINRNCILTLVGDGPLYNDIKKKAQNMKIDNNIIFTGYKGDTSNYYQAFDAFILPSFYEGLPVVSIEAQACGLPCFISENISSECNLTGNVYFLSLEKSAKYWAIEILEKIKKFKRNDTTKQIIQNGFDIVEETFKLEKIYLKGEKNER